MPASPRAAVVGLGSAVLLLLGIPFAAGLIATFAMEDRYERNDVVAEFEAAMAELRKFGVEQDRFPDATDPVWAAFGKRTVFCVDGPMTAFTDGFPLHRLPKSLVAVIQTFRGEDPVVLPLASFENDGVLSDITGSSAGVGTAIGFANGDVIVVRDDMPLRDLRPFLTRDTAVRADREKQIDFHRLRL